MPSRRSWRSPLALAAALSLGTLLSACQTSGSAQLARALPPAPGYVRTVTTPDPKAGEDALVVAARERLGKAQANCIIRNFSDWYERVREVYAKGEDGSALAKEAVAKCGAPAKGRR